MNLRPSLLPKLAECPCYEPEANAGEAAERGTKMDSWFRQVLIGQPNETWCEISNEEATAVQWAVDTCRLFASNAPILASEDDLRVTACGMDGTADAACPDRQWSADLKTGQIRNYHEQQAAYALGFMEKYFVSTWTVHLLFCDERQVVTLEYTSEEAERIVRGVVASAHDANKVPAPCDYCGWCAARFRCKPRLETVAWWIGQDPATINLEESFKDPAKLASLLDLFYDIGKDDGLLDAAKAAAKKLMLDDKTPVPGWKLQSRKGNEYVPAMQFGPFWQDMGFARVLEACGNVSAEKFRQAFADTYPAKKVPEGIIQQSGGSTFVARATKTKKPTTTK